MTGLQSILDGIIEKWETELAGLEDTDSVTGTSIPLFKDVGRGRLDKVVRFPSVYIWLDRGNVLEDHISKTTHLINFIIRVWTETEQGPKELMDELIRLQGKIYDLCLTDRGMCDLVERRSVTGYLFCPRGLQGTIVNAADLFVEIETRFRVT